MGDESTIFVNRISRGSGALTVAVKDSIDIAGVPTRCGSRALEDAPPASRDAAVVRLLLDGDARIVGKTNMHELAYGVTGINGWTGTAPNPRYPGLIPGGSSSGSAAAVAAGLAEVAIGTDTGGSVRVPAVCCGLVGMKLSFGLVSREGVAPRDSSLDCVGVFGRSVDSVTRTMAMIAPGLDVQPLDRAPVLGLVATDAAEPVWRALDAYLDGATLAPVRLPSLAAAFDAGVAVIASEAARAFGALDRTRMGDDVAARLTVAERVSAAEVAHAEEIRVRFAAEVDAALARVDALVLPTLPCVPPTVEEATRMGAPLALTALVRPFNLSGHPAITLPCETADGLPAGVQLVGRRGGDAALLAVAAAIERRA